MAPGAFEHASLAALNAILAALVLSRAGRSWLARVLGLLFAVNVVSPLLMTIEAAGIVTSSATYQRIVVAQSVGSLILLAFLPGLVHREVTGGGQRLLAALVVPAAIGSAINIPMSFAFPGAVSLRTFFLVDLVPWAIVLVGGVVSLVDLAVRTVDPRARQRVHFFLAAFVLATLSTFGMPLGYPATATLDQTIVQVVSFLLLCALLLPLATFLLQRVREVAGGAPPARLTGVEWLLLVAAPVAAIALAWADLGELSYGLLRPILLTSGILWLGLAVEAPASRALSAAVVVLAAAAAALWAAQLIPVPALAPLLGVALALVMLWPVARDALGRPDDRGRRTLYEEALAASLASGAGEQHAPVLRTLRARLGISEKEHGLLEMRLKQGGRELAPETRLFGRYRIERRLGAGATGATYLAHDDQLARRVSLKVAQLPNDEAAERLMHEARTLARLRHPNVPRLLDVERVGQDVLLVLEYVEGEPLDARLRRGPLSVAEGTRVAEDVLSALAALHAHDLVHRDIKPSNVILAPDGRAYLIDFGIATDAARTLTQTGVALPAGTVAYMSPEQLAARPVDARSDLFSLGATLYESLVGETYFPLAGRDLQEVAAAVASDRPRFPAQLPRPLAAWLLRALEKDPRARPASASEMLGELHRAGP